MRKQQKKPVAQGIQRIIQYLEKRSLCSDGQERLRWWKRNQRKFPSVKAALATWSDDQVRAWIDFLGADCDEDDSTFPPEATSREELLNGIIDGLDGNTAIPRSEIRLIAKASVQNVERAYHRIAKVPSLRAWLRSVPESRLIPDRSYTL